MADSSIFAEWTLTELKAARRKLSQAFTNGQQSVSFGDRNVTWNSQSEIREALRQIGVEIDSREGTTPSPRRIPVATTRGWR